MAELFDATMLLDHQSVPAGSRVAIIGNSGGPGILVADVCEEAGLELAELAAGAAISSLEPDLAADTVTELLMLARYAEVAAERDLAAERELGEKGAGLSGAGAGAGAHDHLPATLHLHADDVEGAEWTIATEPQTYARCHERSEVAIRGNAWALARWCWGRPAEGEIELFGDTGQADAWRSSLVE